MTVFRLSMIPAFLAVLVSFVISPLSSKADTAQAYSDPQLLKISTAALSAPLDLVISPDGGYLLIADTGNNEIKVLQPGTLKLLSRFGGEDLKSPEKLEFAGNGQLLVADDGFSRVTVYEFKGVFRDGSANVKKISTGRGTPRSQDTPDTARDTSGQNYRVDADKNRITIFDKDQNQISQYANAGLNAPNAVETVGRYFWIADTGNNRILLLKAPRVVGK